MFPKFFYAVMQEFPTLRKQGHPMPWECIINESTPTGWQDLITDLAQGQWESPVQVLLIEPGKGTVQDVTASALREAAARVETDCPDERDREGLDYYHDYLTR